MTTTNLAAAAAKSNQSGRYRSPTVTGNICESDVEEFALVGSADVNARDSRLTIS